jgi:putative sterol carrier protein
MNQNTITSPAEFAAPASQPVEPKGRMRALLEGMTLAFDGQAAGDLAATLQFNVTAPDPGTYYLRLAAGQCTFHKGTASQPDLTITTPPDVWLAISRGKLSAQEAALRGLYRANGDLSLLMRMGTLFKPMSDVRVAAPPEQRPAGPLPLSGMAWMTLPFVPMTLFWFLFNLPGISPWLSVGLPLALSAAIVGYRLIYDRPTWLESGVGLMFISIAGLVLAGVPAISRWGGAFASLFMGGIWFSSLAWAAAPVSAEYVKWTMIKPLWNLSLFIHPNAVISLVWSWQFLAAGLLGIAAVPLPTLHLPLVLAQYLLMVPAAMFTRRYQQGVRQRVIADPERDLATIRRVALAGLGLSAAIVAVAWLWL